MICPKCGFEQADGKELCLRCGMILMLAAMLYGGYVLYRQKTKA